MGARRLTYEDSMKEQEMVTFFENTLGTVLSWRDLPEWVVENEMRYWIDRACYASLEFEDDEAGEDCLGLVEKYQELFWGNDE
jgi:hypothetical protein